MSAGLLWFLGWTIVLAGMLYYPVSKLVWVMSVRRMERKLERNLEEDELRGQLRRARFLSVVLVVAFALLFNFNVFGIPQSP